LIWIWIFLIAMCLCDAFECFANLILWEECIMQRNAKDEKKDIEFCEYWNDFAVHAVQVLRWGYVLWNS